MNLNQYQKIFVPNFITIGKRVVFYNFFIRVKWIQTNTKNICKKFYYIRRVRDFFYYIFYIECIWLHYHPLKESADLQIHFWIRALSDAQPRLAAGHYSSDDYLPNHHFINPPSFRFDHQSKQKPKQRYLGGDNPCIGNVFDICKHRSRRVPVSFTW